MAVQATKGLRPVHTNPLECASMKIELNWIPRIRINHANTQKYPMRIPLLIMMQYNILHIYQPCGFCFIGANIGKNK